MVCAITKNVLCMYTVIREKVSLTLRFICAKAGPNVSAIDRSRFAGLAGPEICSARRQKVAKAGRTAGSLTIRDAVIRNHACVACA